MGGWVFLATELKAPTQVNVTVGKHHYKTLQFCSKLS